MPDACASWRIRLSRLRVRARQDTSVQIFTRVVAPLGLLASGAEIFLFYSSAFVLPGLKGPLLLLDGLSIVVIHVLALLALSFALAVAWGRQPGWSAAFVVLLVLTAAAPVAGVPALLVVAPAVYDPSQPNNQLLENTSMLLLLAPIVVWLPAFIWSLQPVTRPSAGVRRSG
jgi:hypothetical protein